MLKKITWGILSILLAVILIKLWMVGGKAGESTSSSPSLILYAAEYQDANLSSIQEQLAHRIQIQPFNLISLTLFILAIIHTFFARRISMLADQIKKKRIATHKRHIETFAVEILHFFGETEIIFGLWVVPLLIAMGSFYGWDTTIHYLEQRDYTEPLFVVVIMLLASTKPILHLAEQVLELIANLGGGKAKAWWLTILTVGPLLGSFITEPGAMTISALLLIKRFYRFSPSPLFSYATLGLLFTNISVGGVLTSFAAPPILMVSKVWGWNTAYMMDHFCLKAIVGIVLANAVYFLFFNSAFEKIDKKQKEASKHIVETALEEPIPLWITAIHVLALSWCVIHGHHSVIFIGTFLLFLGFYQATRLFQNELELKASILVGLFLAGLVIHGSLQAWWISPLLTRASHEGLLFLSLALTSFNDNAAVTYLASLIPSFDESLKQAVVIGAITGGGLTVIANAPNPAGQSLLGKYFDEGVSASKLFAGALVPTVIMVIIFYFL